MTEKRCIWFHAVSVGEVNATRLLIGQLEKTFEDFEILITATTDTGFAQAQKLYAQKHTVSYFPFDISKFVTRALENIRPDIICLMELEVWPNLVAAAKENNIPVIVINGRISDKSFPIYRRFKPLVKNTFAKLDLFLAQNSQYADRARQLGTPEQNIIVTGSLKYDTAATQTVNNCEQFAASISLFENQTLWVAGGTGNDEEQKILNVYKKLVTEFKNLRLAIVPRKPERFDSVAKLIEENGFKIIRYSKIKTSSHEGTIDPEAIILGDTMGDLKKFYAVCDIIFVGRSLVPMGGSDMMEAAALGKCTIFGPHTFNFRQTAQELVSKQGAIEAADEKDLLLQIKKCLNDPEYAKAIAEKGAQIINSNRGATEKTVKQIHKLLMQ